MPTKPPGLKPGDLVAVLSPSWGGPSCFPWVFEAGLETMRSELGLKIKEYPTTRARPEVLRADPRARAHDFQAALEDPEVKAIFAAVGGDDSIRMLPFLEPDSIRPKVLMGYSDVTTLLLHVRRAGVVSFHGPTVMAGLAQARNYPSAFLEHLRQVLFVGAAIQY